jgi:hypothetical protein
MSTRAIARDVFRRHPRQTKRLFCALTGLKDSNAERVIAYSQRDNLIKSRPFLENGTRLYSLTAQGARSLGLDERKFRRAAGAQTVSEALLIGWFCAQEGHKLLTDDEFAELLPQQASCRGRYARRYFIDHKRDSLLALIVLDFGARASRIASRARREVERRKPSQAWRDLIYHKLLQVVVATQFGAMKAEKIAEELRNFTTPHAVVAVRGLEDLFLGGIK